MIVSFLSYLHIFLTADISRFFIRSRASFQQHFWFEKENLNFRCTIYYLLNMSCPVLANSVGPDQLASEEAN